MVHVVATGSFQVGGSVLKQSSGRLIPMEGVSVSLLQDGESDTQLTDANGTYAMSINASSSLKLTAQKPHEPGQASRGVDVLDIVAIRKHILVRTDAFLEDMNGEKVSFWRFVASDFQSVDVSQAFAEVDAAQSIDYPSINANISDADFLAVKLGDVNDDWSAPSSSTTQNVFVGGRRPQTERFALGSPREMEDGYLHLEFETWPGQSYAIETKQSLAKGDWQTWKVVEATGQSHSFQVFVNEEADRYFRVRSSNWSKGLKSSLNLQRKVVYKLQCARFIDSY